jgi:hypothetical protein
MYFPSIQVITPVYTIESDGLRDGFVVIISAVPVLAQMVLVAAVVGVSVTVTATERVDIRLVLSGVLGWSFVPVLQLATGLVLVRGSRESLGWSLERYFATHWPWSLTILAAHAALLLIPWFRGRGLWLAGLAVLPIFMTIRLLLALCKGPLRMEPRLARRRVAEHQLLTLLLIVLYVQVTTALWPRVVGVFS